jgi:CobQ-like glutamine amidotransferase family enzyme
VGFENHGGETALESSALGTVRVGFGNDGDVDGVRSGSLFGTYLHGPVLALNPWFADAVLSEALGADVGPLETPADALYEARVSRLLA